MKDKKKKESKTKLADLKGQRLVLPFDRKEESVLLKRVGQKRTFEETKKIRFKEELTQIWDEDLCE